jgi:hypothetical protein
VRPTEERRYMMRFVYLYDAGCTAKIREKLRKVTGADIVLNLPKRVSKAMADEWSGPAYEVAEESFTKVTLRWIGGGKNGPQPDIVIPI